MRRPLCLRLVFMIRKLYPRGKAKAFNVSYDDGIGQDIRFVELLNRYGLKGTFNLNSGLMKLGFAWTHENGQEIRRLPEQTAAGLYRGHEVASHTMDHPYMDSLSEAEILRQMTMDKENLEKLFGCGIFGFAVPFTYYSELIAKCAHQAGFEYARISEEGNTFAVPADFYYWRAGKFNWSEDLEEFVDSFLATSRELAICQIAGHSYDLDIDRSWDRMEAILSRVSRAEDVLPMTHIELVRYLKAMSHAVITETQIKNNSQASLWFDVNGQVIRLYPGEKYELTQGGTNP